MQRTRQKKSRHKRAQNNGPCRVYAFSSAPNSGLRAGVLGQVPVFLEDLLRAALALYVRFGSQAQQLPSDTSMKEREEMHS